MFVTRTVDAVSYAASLAEVKAAARVTGSAEDTFLNLAIAGASDAVGEMAGRVLTAETWAYSLSASEIGADVVLPKSPVSSVSSISYFDADDGSQTANVSDFYLMKGDDRAVLRPKPGVAWPSVNADRDDALTITFVAGYSTCPNTLKQAVILLAVHRYQVRGQMVDERSVEVPFGVQELVNLERLGWVSA